MRRELEARPLLILTIGLVVGLTSVKYPLNLLALVLCLIALESLKTRILLAAAFVAGALFAPPPVDLLKESLWLEGKATVVSMPKLYGNSESLEMELGSKRVLVYTSSERAFTPGDQILIHGLARPFPEGREGYAQARRLIGRMSDPSLRLQSPGPAVYHWADRWRRNFRAFTETNLSPEAASLVDALCFNMGGELSDQTRASLQSTGTAHIVSASGLHVVLFAAALTFLFSLLPVPRAFQLALLGAVLSLYAVAAGLQAPVIRAVVMSLIGASAYWWRREPDGLSALSLAAIVFLLWRPGTVYEAGFHLSFVVVAGLILFGASRRQGEPRFMLRLRQGGVATAVSAPLTAYWFGMVSIVGLPANLAVAIVVPFVLFLALLAHGLSYLAADAGAGLMVFVEPLVNFLTWLVGVFDFKFASVGFPTVSGYWIALIYGAMLFLWRPRVIRA